MNKQDDSDYCGFMYPEMYSCNYIYTNERGNLLFKRTKYYEPSDHIDYVYDSDLIEQFSEEDEVVDLEYIYKDKRFETLRIGWNYDEGDDYYFLYNLKNIVADINKNKSIFFFKNEEEVEVLKNLGYNGTCFADFPYHEDKETLYDLLKILKRSSIYIIDDDWLNDKKFLEVLTKIAKEVKVVKIDEFSPLQHDFVQTFAEAFGCQYYITEEDFKKAVENAQPINLEDFS